MAGEGPLDNIGNRTVPTDGNFGKRVRRSRLQRYGVISFFAAFAGGVRPSVPRKWKAHAFELSSVIADRRGCDCGSAQRQFVPAFRQDRDPGHPIAYTDRHQTTAPWSRSPFLLS